MQTKRLANALAMVGRFVHPRSPLDKFRMVWIREASGGTTLSTSSTTGSIEVFIDEECGTNACVQHAILSGVIRSIKQDEVGLRVSGPVLDIYTPTGKLSIPDYEMPAPEVDMAADVGVCVASADLRNCSRKLRSLCDSSELRFSHSQRLYVDEGLLRVVCSNSRAWGCAWCESNGGEIDIMIPNNSIQAAVECMPGVAVSLSLMPGGISVVSNEVAMMLPSELQGVQHRPYSSASKAWEAAHEWNVDRQSMREFLGQVSVFATPEATGFWLIPTVDGLMCRYTGRADGTYSKDMSVNGYCESLVSGQCDGDPMYVSSVLMSQAIDAANDEGFSMRATRQGVFILSDSFAWGVGGMTPPQEVGS
jgi:hypothetical protein